MEAYIYPLNDVTMTTAALQTIYNTVAVPPSSAH